MGLHLNAIENEAIMLKAIKIAIDSMVNFGLMELLGDDSQCQVMFHSSSDKQLFSIYLVDFLSCTDDRAPVKKTSYLSALKSICQTPALDPNGPVQSLREATAAFADWLNEEIDAESWFPSLELKTTLKIKRIDFLKMCGDLCKHNFLRAVGVAKDFQATLAKVGHGVSLEDALLALEDFHERFYHDIFGYHASAIAEFLNNIRWGIYEYLLPEFTRSIAKDANDPSSYRYTYPRGVGNKFAKTCYWDLMNEVRNKPFTHRFQVEACLKGRY